MLNIIADSLLIATFQRPVPRNHEYDETFLTRHNRADGKRKSRSWLSLVGLRF